MAINNLTYQEAYHRGFLLGYQAGFADCLRNRPAPDFEHLDALPIEALGLSSRAYNCLYFSGCRTTADVVRLKETEIQQIRNLGKKTASEIAHMLVSLGILGTQWELFFIPG